MNVAREKYWSERTAEERCEVLAGVVGYLLREVQGLARVVAKLEQHDHVAGRVVGPLWPRRPGEFDYDPTANYLHRINQAPPSPEY